MSKILSKEVQRKQYVQKGIDMQVYKKKRGKVSMGGKGGGGEPGKLSSKNIHQRAIRVSSLFFFIKQFERVGVGHSCLR